MEPYELVSREKILSAKIIDVYSDKITLPNGKTTIREIVERGNSAAILAILPDKSLLFVRQYRHATGSHQIEIPAGMLDDGEEPMEAAKRELEEETGYKAGRIWPLFDFYTSIGFCTERCYLFAADQLEIGIPNPDEDEFVEIIRISPEEALRKAYAGDFHDAKTIMAILAVQDILRQ